MFNLKMHVMFCALFSTTRPPRWFVSGGGAWFKALGQATFTLTMCIVVSNFENFNRYKGVDVKNFTSSFKNGMAFNAIIHRFRPDIIDYEVSFYFFDEFIVKM